MRRFCALLCCLFLLGGHLAVLQGVAWVGMVGDRLANCQSIKQALSETFDGEHPCALCSAVQDLQEQAPIIPSDKVVKKAEKTHLPVFFMPLSVMQSEHVASVFVKSSRSFTAEVETPPPRV
jgi:hypothetical protein